MRSPRFYTSEPLVVGTTVALPSNVFRHAIQVLRLKPGAQLTLFNGQGGEFQARLSHVTRHDASADLEVFVDHNSESPLSIILVQSVSRGEHMDYTVQKATELGVDAIQPVLSERGVVNLKGERLAKKLLHWRKIAVSACEQSGRNRLPRMPEPIPLSDWLIHFQKNGLALLLDPRTETRLHDLTVTEKLDVILLIGPEGGWAPAELASAEHYGFTGVTLGPRILRTETAAIAAIAALQILWGDMG